MNTAAEVTTEKKNSKTNPKRLLKRTRHDFKIGDIVTINDDSPLYAYILKSISGNEGIVLGIDLTDEKDDLIEYELPVQIDELLYLGDSFINVCGALWNIREHLLSCEE